MTLSSVMALAIGSVDEVSFVRKCFTVRFVDSKGDPLDPVLRHQLEGVPGYH
jgi:hypothetical protein